MEEAPVTAATGALGPVITKLAALLGNEYKLRWRTRRDVKFIRSKLQPVHSILSNIWEEELDAPSTALKMEALDLADDMEDAVDDFILAMQFSRRNKRLVQTKIKASHFHDFKKRASDVSRRCCSKWEEKEISAGDESSPAGKPRAYPFVRKDASQLVGLIVPKYELVGHLVGEFGRTPVDLQLKIATIFGPAGVGKTTLADLVYEEIKDKFDSLAFVTVARPGGDMRVVLARILQQVAPNIAGTNAAATEEDLIDVISNFLKDKRYLVTIDEIWHSREWEIIMKCLPENNLGSRIVRTTPIFARANDYFDPNDYPHDMLPSEKSGSEWLYQFTQMRGMNADLVAEDFDYNHPIVHMCGGTPLALLCMLSAVAQELEKQGENAKTCDVQDEIEKHVMENGIQNTPGFEAMVESLQLRYDDLPHHMMKTCLLYCSIYCQGDTFKKDNLVRRWIYEGFVYEQEEANSYFEELVSRGLIGNVGDSYWRIHPMMLYFLRWKSRQDNFITCSSEITPSYNITSRIRRLCIYEASCSRHNAADPLSALDWYHVRSLVVYEGIERVPLEKLERVRVLDLCDTTYITDDHWKGICGLFRLRYLLGLSGAEIRKIPPEIVRMQCLETFEARGEVRGGFLGILQQLKTLELRGPAITELPSDIVALQQLQTLGIRDTGIIELPKEIGELQQLKTLDISHTLITVLPKEIGKLQRLKTLDISYTKIKMLPKEMGKLQKLEYLLMAKTDVSKIPREIGKLKELKGLRFGKRIVAPELPLEVCTFVEVPECIQQSLSKSELAVEMLSYQKPRFNTVTGGLVVGAKQMHIPTWIRAHFNDIALLDIRVCKLEEEGLKTLREMPHLEELTLRFEVVPREQVVISSQGFSNLNRLTIDSRVPRVTFQKGALRSLRFIMFRFQFYAGPPNIDPVGINHLVWLSTIKFECNEDWYGGADSPCIRTTIDVMKKEAQELNFVGNFEVCGRKEEIRWLPLETEEERSSGEGEIEDGEEEWSSGEGEIEEEVEEERSSGEGEIEEEQEVDWGID